MHRSSNCCKDIRRNLRSTSVSKGSVIHSWRVILALLVIPFPGRDTDLGLGGSCLMSAEVARSRAASLRLANAERRRLSDPGRVFVADGRDVCRVDAGSLSSRFLLRGSAQVVEGVAVQSYAASWV